MLNAMNMMAEAFLIILGFILVLIWSPSITAMRFIIVKPSMAPVNTLIGESVVMVRLIIAICVLSPNSEMNINVKKAARLVLDVWVCSSLTGFTR